MESENEAIEVCLHVYDLTGSMAKIMSTALIGDQTFYISYFCIKMYLIIWFLILGKQIDGIWHTGIVAFGREYFFGGAGIQSCEPVSYYFFCRLINFNLTQSKRICVQINNHLLIIFVFNYCWRIRWPCARFPTCKIPFHLSHIISLDIVQHPSWIFATKNYYQEDMEEWVERSVKINH